MRTEESVRQIASCDPIFLKENMTWDHDKALNFIVSCIKAGVKLLNIYFGTSQAGCLGECFSKKFLNIEFEIPRLTNILRVR